MIMRSAAFVMGAPTLRPLMEPLAMAATASELAS